MYNYASKEKKIEYEKKVVLFVDLLGFKDLVKHSDMERIEYFMQKFHDIVETFKQYIDIYFFSDCFYAFAQKEKVELLLDFLAKLQYELFYINVIDINSIDIDDMYEDGVKVEWCPPVRGGLAYGDVYIKDDIFFGPAIIEAYEAESQKAVFPIVVICENLKGIVPEEYSIRRKNMYFDWKKYILDKEIKEKDALNNIIESYVKKYITPLLKNSKISKKVKQKYIWYEQYLNNKI